MSYVKLKDRAVPESTEATANGRNQDVAMLGHGQPESLERFERARTHG